MKHLYSRGLVNDRTLAYLTLLQNRLSFPRPSFTHSTVNNCSVLSFSVLVASLL